MAADDHMQEAVRALQAAASYAKSCEEDDDSPLIESQPDAATVPTWKVPFFGLDGTVSCGIRRPKPKIFCDMCCESERCDGACEPDSNEELNHYFCDCCRENSDDQRALEWGWYRYSRYGTDTVILLCGCYEGGNIAESREASVKATQK